MIKTVLLKYIHYYRKFRAIEKAYGQVILQMQSKFWIVFLVSCMGNWLPLQAHALLLE